MCHDMIMAHPLFNKPDRGLGIIQKHKGQKLRRYGISVPCVYCLQ